MNTTDVVCQEPPAGPFADWMRTNSTNIPMLPEVATRVISLAASPDITISRLAQVISKDQVLTTRLLSLANSAYYGSPIDVNTVPEAIMRVGAVAVRNLAVTLCVTARMQDRNVYGAHGQQLVDHGIGTAYLARLVAEDADVNTESAFLCGLLHDIGKMVILKWHHDHTKRTGSAAAASGARRSPAAVPRDDRGSRVPALGPPHRARRAGALPSRLHPGHDRTAHGGGRLPRQSSESPLRLWL